MQIRKFMTIILCGSLVLVSASASAWYVGADYESQNEGALCMPFWDSGADNTVSSNVSSSGSKSCKVAMKINDQGVGSGFNFPQTIPPRGEIWIRKRVFLMDGFDRSTSSKLKWIRLSMYNPSGTVGRLDWQLTKDMRNAVGLERANNVPYWEYSNGAPVNGQWDTMELYVKFDYTSVDDGGQGRWRIWRNGVLQGDITSQATMWPGSTYVKDMRFIDHWNDGAPKTQYLYLDDLIITNERPSSKDAVGNPYIGMGNFVVDTVSEPLPPNVSP